MEVRTGAHFADSELFSAAEALQHRVIPGFDPHYFRIDGGHPAAIASVEDALLGDNADVWHEPNICMAFQMYVQLLFYYRRVCSYVQFSDDERPVTIERLDALAPETIYPRRGGRRGGFDQYVRANAADEEVFFRFEPSELFVLEWPLSSPPAPHTPYAAALKAGSAADRLMERVPLTLEAQNEPGESFLTFARARLGAYADAFEDSRRVSARVRGMAYDGVREPLTQYFDVEWALRNQTAACDLRSYLIGQFNEQVLRRWAALNGWGRLELAWVPRQLTSGDWADVWESFAAGNLSYEDVVEFLRLDRDAAKLPSPRP